MLWLNIDFEDNLLRKVYLFHPKYNWKDERERESKSSHSLTMTYENKIVSGWCWWSVFHSHCSDKKDRDVRMEWNDRRWKIKFRHKCFPIGRFRWNVRYLLSIDGDTSILDWIISWESVCSQYLPYSSTFSTLIKLHFIFKYFSTLWYPTLQSHLISYTNCQMKKSSIF